MDTKIEEVKKALKNVEQQIDNVVGQLTKVEQQIDDVVGQLTEAAKADVPYLREKEAQLRKEKEQLRKEKEQLREERLLLLKAVTSDSVVKDNSREWMKHMLLPEHTLPRLPQHEHDLEKVLFPEQPGKLPVLMLTYNEILGRDSAVAEKYLIPADLSKLPLAVTELVSPTPAPVNSEVDVTATLIHNFRVLFHYWKTYSSFTFTCKLLFNLNEKAGDSRSETTRKRSRPDTLLTASGCTFLVGEDKCSSIIAAKRDLEGKMQPLSAIFYGEVQFILGYIAAGYEFQWVYINKGGKIREVGRRLDLSNDTHRCQFLLSIGYAYQLISEMVRTVPEVPGRRAMFDADVQGDRVIYFYSNYVRKSIKNFGMFCESVGTELDVIRKAYKAGEKKGCSSLPRLIGKEQRISRTDTYTVKISPLGYSPTLRSEHDISMLAKNVCEALSVLHEAGLVHRDVRYPNIVQVSKEQFMLIDLETVAVAPFQVPDGFVHFAEWSDEMLVEGSYTPLSDMYQLGRLLEDHVPYVLMAPARQFIRKLLQKEYTAELALCDPWLSDPIL